MKYHSVLKLYTRYWKERHGLTNVAVILLGNGDGTFGLTRREEFAANLADCIFNFVSPFIK